MAIIKYVKDYKVPQDAIVNIYPDQYVSESEKDGDGWKKTNMDYFYTVAINKYAHNKKTFARNYEIVKGILRREDFWEPEVQSFTQTLMSNNDLPQYIQHYSILASPISDLVGEMSKRPDNTFVKAFDDDSKSEEFQFKTDVLQQYILQNARQRIAAQLAMEGIELEDSDLSAMTEEQMAEQISTYSSTAEKWGARMLDFLKVRFGMKEKSEDAFRDLLITAREFFHIYEDKSEMGFGIEIPNPRNVWFATTPDQKYISDPFDRYKGAYAAGTIEIMEMSEILNKFDLTYEEVKHLKDYSQQNYLLSGHESNLVNPIEGHQGIQYDTYNPLLLQERLLLESELSYNSNDELSTFLLPGSEVSTFGNKFIVVRAYWCSKKKIGELKYINEDGEEIITIVDESYKDGEHPRQISLEWGWINQWYQGVKIGPDIYYVKPFELLDYCPIIGSIFEGRNTEAKSLVDMLKPFQTLCNIYMNKLYESIQKDVGPVFLTSLRSLPTPKDGDAQDAIEIWMAEARERGVIFIDDNPENLASASNFNQYKVQDMSRVKEMQGYFDMYFKIKQEALEIVGLSRQRLGSVQATETATATNAALTQSYAQTEPWFVHHEYTMNKVYQAVLDAAQYVESNKPESIISYISNEGEHGFIKVNGSDLRLRNLGVLVTSRSEDAQTFKELRQLSQAMLQNGATPYDVVSLYTTKSTRHLKDTFKRLKDQQEQMMAQAQQLEQQKLEQAQQQFVQAQQLENARQDKELENENMNKALDRESKERIAIITATGYGQVTSEDLDNDGIADVLEQQRIMADESRTAQEHSLKLQELNQRQQEILNSRTDAAEDRKLEREKLQVEREKIQATKDVAKMNKNKYDSKSKKK